MKKADFITLFCICLLILLGVAALEPVPGYMDADYYYAGGLNLLAGRGFNDPYLWNFLDNPVSLPHPSHTYWMPMPSILAYLSMVIFGKSDFFTARLPFLAMASLIAPLTAWLAFRLTSRRVSGWLAGGLAIFSGYYLIFVGLVETFAITMLAGGIFLTLVGADLQKIFKSFLIGVLAGCLHMSRADGLLWLVMGGFFLFWVSRKEKLSLKSLIALAGALLGGYLLVAGWWYFRNLTAFGSLFPPGNSRSLWLSDYDQLFKFPPDSLNFGSWWNAGVNAIIQTRWNAFLSNIQTTVAVQSQIFLLPLMVIGAWRLRKNIIVNFAFWMWLALFGLMMLVFPLAGSRGGFFHAGASVQLVWWAVTPVGLEALIEVGIRHRKWKMERALKGFSIIIVFLVLVISIGLVYSRTVGENPEKPVWSQYNLDYQEAERALVRLGANPEERVMVNNPPGYFLAAQRSAIMIPDGDETTVRSVARLFNVKYLILDDNTVKTLAGMYLNPGSINGLSLLETLGVYQIYRIEP